VLNSSNL